MKTIQKLRIDFAEGWQEFQLPGYRQGRTVSADGAGNLCVWVLVDTEQPEITTAFGFIKTGEPLIEEEGATYVGTVAIGPEGYHLFERRIEWPLPQQGLPEEPEP